MANQDLTRRIRSTHGGGNLPARTTELSGLARRFLGTQNQSRALLRLAESEDVKTATLDETRYRHIFNRDENGRLVPSRFLRANLANPSADVQDQARAAVQAEAYSAQFLLEARSTITESLTGVTRTDQAIEVTNAIIESAEQALPDVLFDEIMPRLRAHQDQKVQFVREKEWKQSQQDLLSTHAAVADELSEDILDIASTGNFADNGTLTEVFRRWQAVTGSMLDNPVVNPQFAASLAASERELLTNIANRQLSATAMSIVPFDVQSMTALEAGIRDGSARVLNAETGEVVPYSQIEPNQLARTELADTLVATQRMRERAVALRENAVADGYMRELMTRYADKLAALGPGDPIPDDIIAQINSDIDSNRFQPMVRASLADERNKSIAHNLQLHRALDARGASREKFEYELNKLPLDDPGVVTALATFFDEEFSVADLMEEYEDYPQRAFQKLQNIADFLSQASVTSTAKQREMIELDQSLRRWRRLPNAADLETGGAGTSFRFDTQAIANAPWDAADPDHRRLWQERLGTDEQDWGTSLPPARDQLGVLKTDGEGNAQIDPTADYPFATTYWQNADEIKFFQQASGGVIPEGLANVFEMANVITPSSLQDQDFDLIRSISSVMGDLYDSAPQHFLDTVDAVASSDQSRRQMLRMAATKGNLTRADFNNIFGLSERTEQVQAIAETNAWDDAIVQRFQIAVDEQIDRGLRNPLVNNPGNFLSGAAFVPHDHDPVQSGLSNFFSGAPFVPYDPVQSGLRHFLFGADVVGNPLFRSELLTESMKTAEDLAYSPVKHDITAAVTEAFDKITLHPNKGPRLRQSGYTHQVWNQGMSPIETNNEKRWSPSFVEAGAREGEYVEFAVESVFTGPEIGYLEQAWQFVSTIDDRDRLANHNAAVLGNREEGQIDSPFVRGIYIDPALHQALISARDAVGVVRIGQEIGFRSLGPVGPDNRKVWQVALTNLDRAPSTVADPVFLFDGGIAMTAYKTDLTDWMGNYVAPQTPARMFAPTELVKQLDRFPGILPAEFLFRAMPSGLFNSARPGEGSFTHKEMMETEAAVKSGELPVYDYIRTRFNFQNQDVGLPIDPAQ